MDVDDIIIGRSRLPTDGSHVVADDQMPIGSQHGNNFYRKINEIDINLRDSIPRIRRELAPMRK